ncbi:MAG: hypothetical protein GTN69_10545 [Armatimonadetes bacterium]|nr:hypothetical protein [Armatimonadota bacterium]
MSRNKDRRALVEQIAADPDNERWTDDERGQVWNELHDLWELEDAGKLGNVTPVAEVEIDHVWVTKIGRQITAIFADEDGAVGMAQTGEVVSKYVLANGPIVVSVPSTVAGVVEALEHIRDEAACAVDDDEGERWGDVLRVACEALDQLRAAPEQSPPSEPAPDCDDCTNYASRAGQCPGEPCDHYEPAPATRADLVAAVRLGYMSGHHDTAESQYGDPDEVASDLVDDLISEGTITRPEPAPAEPKGSTCATCQHWDDCEGCHDGPMFDDTPAGPEGDWPCEDCDMTVDDAACSESSACKLMATYMAAAEPNHWSELEEWIAENTPCRKCGQVPEWRDGLMYHRCGQSLPRRQSPDLDAMREVERALRRLCTQPISADPSLRAWQPGFQHRLTELADRLAKAVEGADCPIDCSEETPCPSCSRPQVCTECGDESEHVVCRGCADRSQPPEPCGEAGEIEQTLAQFSTWLRRNRRALSDGVGLALRSLVDTLQVQIRRLPGPAKVHSNAVAMSLAKELRLIANRYHGDWRALPERLRKISYEVERLPGPAKAEPAPADWCKRCQEMHAPTIRALSELAEKTPCKLCGKPPVAFGGFTCCDDCAHNRRFEAVEWIEANWPGPAKVPAVVEISLPHQMLEYDHKKGKYTGIKRRDIVIRAAGSDWDETVRHHGCGGDFEWMPIEVHGAPAECEKCEGLYQRYLGACKRHNGARRERDQARAELEETKRKLEIEEQQTADARELALAEGDRYRAERAAHEETRRKYDLCMQSAMSVDGDCFYCEDTMQDMRDENARLKELVGELEKRSNGWN